MEPTDDRGKAAPSSRTPDREHGAAAPVAADVAGGHPFGPNAASILATEHWSLLGTRSQIWNEALNRATVFLTVLSASIIALALLADATGFGAHTTTVALVLLPVVLLLGVATYVRLVQINTEDAKLVLAMNRLRYAYLKIEPGLEPYFSTGHHDDERGLLATYMDDRSRRWLRDLVYFLINTPTIVATVVAALAAAIAVLVLQAVEMPRAAVVAGGVVAFLAVWGGLMPLQRNSVDPLRGTTPRFPTPPDTP
jgi:hypothetical protein